MEYVSGLISAILITLVVTFLLLLLMRPVTLAKIALVNLGFLALAVAIGGFRFAAGNGPDFGQALALYGVSTVLVAVFEAVWLGRLGRRFARRRVPARR